MQNPPCSLTDQQKLDLLQKHRMPGLGFTYPYGTKKTQGLFVDEAFIRKT